MSIMSRRVRKNPDRFRASDGAWKPLYQVGNEVADDYFFNILEAINSDYTAVTTPEKKSQPMISDYAASLRFYAYLRGVLEQIIQNPGSRERLVKESSSKGEEKLLAARENIEDQWKIEVSTLKTNRGAADAAIDKEEAFILKPEQWSTVFTRANGDLGFFQLRKKGTESGSSALWEKVMEIQQLLSVDVQKVLMHQLLADMQKKHALSLRYLDTSRDEEE